MFSKIFPLYLLDLFLESEEDNFSSYLHMHESLHMTPMLNSTLLIKKRRQRKAHVTYYAEAMFVKITKVLLIHSNIYSILGVFSASILLFVTISNLWKISVNEIQRK